MYHTIRGQSTIKLYVIFNVLELMDKLCCSFGVDILDSLFSKATIKSSQGTEHFRPIPHFIIAFVYVSKFFLLFFLFMFDDNNDFIFIVFHTLVLFYQMVTLNVALNSSNGMFTLLMSNQFVELKSSVFKKFSKENVFQMTCSGTFFFSFF